MVESEVKIFTNESIWIGVRAMWLAVQNRGWRMDYLCTITLEEACLLMLSLLVSKVES